MPAPNLLVHFDGANGSTAFADASLSGFALTAMGSAAISTATSYFGGSSGYFAGGANRVTIPANSAFNIGTSDFTVEAFVYPTVLDSNGRAIILQANNVANNNNRSWGMAISSGGMSFYYTTDGVTDQSVPFSCSPAANAWNHFRVVRKSGVIYGFFNGTLISSSAFTANIFSSTADVCIGTFGKYAEDGYPQLSFQGYIDELAFWNGYAASTASFTPPLAPYDIGNFVIPDLLLHFDDAIGSTTFSDSSGNGITFSTAGSVVVTEANAAYGQSCYTPDPSGALGGGKQFTTPPELIPGTGDFTWEATIQPSAYPPSTPGYNVIYVSDYSGGLSIGLDTSGHITVAKATVAVYLTSTSVMSTSTPTRVRLVRQSGTGYLFINGSLEASATFSNNLPGNLGCIGHDYGNTGAYTTFRGSIWNMSWSPFSKGTSSYAVLPYETAGYVATNLNSSNPSIVSTSYQGSTAYNFTFGGTSLSLPGSSWLTSTNSVFAFGIGDFTVSLRGYFTSAPNANQVIFTTETFPNTDGFYLFYDSSTIKVICGSTVIISAAFNLDLWHHVVVTRRSGTAYLYVDGALVGSGSMSSNMTNSTIWIGRPNDVAGYFAYGYLDEFAIWKGTSIYRTAFFPPVSPYNGVTGISVAIASGQSNASTVIAAAEYYDSIITAAQANQSSSLAAKETIYFSTSSSQASGSTQWFAGLAISCAITSGQKFASNQGQLKEAFQATQSSGQANQSSNLAFLVGNPIIVSVSSGQAGQSSQAVAQRLIPSSISTGQTHQSTIAKAIVSYTSPGLAISNKTTSYMDFVDTRSIMENAGNKFEMDLIERKWVMPKRQQKGLIK